MAHPAKLTAIGVTGIVGMKERHMANPASGWTVVKATSNRAVWRRRMKANTSHQKPTVQPKPLSIEQLNAIDLLITGKAELMAEMMNGDGAEG
jgi:hypothetical protein